MSVQLQAAKGFGILQIPPNLPNQLARLAAFSLNACLQPCTGT